MKHLAIVVLLGILAAAQQPKIQEQDLSKPGQAQAVQPAAPVQTQPAPEKAPAPQPAPQPAPSEVQAPQQPAGTTQHEPVPEERERGQQGKPVAAFWTVIPGK